MCDYVGVYVLETPDASAVTTNKIIARFKLLMKVLRMLAVSVSGNVRFNLVERRGGALFLKRRSGADPGAVACRPSPAVCSGLGSVTHHGWGSCAGVWEMGIQLGKAALG